MPVGIHVVPAADEIPFGAAEPIPVPRPVNPRRAMTVQMLPVGSIEESATNPRKRYDAQALAQLIESVKAVGLVHPLLVRPMTKDSGAFFEIVAGHRRFRAAVAADFEHIPCVVEAMTAGEALERQLIENLQREGIHPLEEAEGYERLHREARQSVPEIAAKVGKSSSYVYQRLKLCALAPDVRERFYTGKLPASHAVLVARIPDPKLQAMACEEIAGEARGEPMSFRDAFAHIRARYMLSLSNAPFDTKDDLLHPSAGPCTTCPKRTGNSPDLFGDVDRADVCTDPGCFEAKGAAAWQVQVDTATALGNSVMSLDESRALFRSGLALSTKWLGLDVPCPEDRKRRTWRELLGAQTVPLTIARDDRGLAVALAQRTDVMKALAKSESPAAKKMVEEKTLEKAATKEETEERELRESVAEQVLIAGADHIRKHGLEPADLRMLVLARIDYSLPKSWLDRHDWDSEKLARAKVEKASGKELAAFLFELSIGPWLDDQWTGYSAELKAVAKRFELSLSQIEKAQRAAAEAEALFKKKGRKADA